MKDSMLSLLHRLPDIPQPCMKFELTDLYNGLIQMADQAATDNRPEWQEAFGASAAWLQWVEEVIRREVQKETHRIMQGGAS